jgi:hypothetical protein
MITIRLISAGRGVGVDDGDGDGEGVQAGVAVGEGERVTVGWAVAKDATGACVVMVFGGVCGVDCEVAAGGLDPDWDAGDD